MENDENFIKKKKILMGLNTGELNKNLLYYINEARCSPKDFSRHLMIDDDVDVMISKLSLFFKYSSNAVYPLIIDRNLEKCSQELLYHIISVDNEKSSFKFTQKEKERNCLKERLKRLNLIPTYHIDLLIIGIDTPIEVLSKILINKVYRKKILSPEMQYIGIASGFLPSERLCYVIDIVSSFKIYNTCLNYNMNNARNYNNFNKSHIKYNKFNQGEDEEDYYCNNTNNMRYNNVDIIHDNNYNPNKRCRYPIKKIYMRNTVNPYGIANSKNSFYENEYCNKYGCNTINVRNEEIGDLRISKQKSISPFNDSRFYKTIYDSPKQFKIPVSISFEKKYAKNEQGKIFPIYSRESKYDDGSVLIQPYYDEYDDANFN